VEIVLADAVAERMQWELGEERFIGFGAVKPALRLAGTIAPARRRRRILDPTCRPRSSRR
jgi:hypothetical protein